MARQRNTNVGVRCVCVEMDGEDDPENQEPAGGDSENGQSEFAGFTPPRIHQDSPPGNDSRQDQQDDEDDHQPRVRQYHPQCSGPYVVRIREKQVKMMPVKCAAHINTKYASVKEIQRGQGSIKVTLNDRQEANDICVDSFFEQFLVSIPADLVEVEGAVNMDDLCDLGDITNLLFLGRGRFDNPLLKPCRILEAQRLYRVSEEGRVRTLTNTIKLTFEGRLLPKHIVYENLLVRVRPFHQKPMFCDVCQQFGHTLKHCKRTPKCARCSGKHATTECTVTAPTNLCPYCLAAHAPGKQSCPYFQEVSESFKQRQNNRRKTRYTQAVASARASAAQAAIGDQDQHHSAADNFPPLQNRYASLPIDEPQENNAGTAAHPPGVPSTSRSSPNPPTNIYAKHQHRSAAQRSNGASQRSPSKRRRDGSCPTPTRPQPPGLRGSAQSAPSVTVWPSVHHASQAPAPPPVNGLKAIIISLAKNAGISSMWLTILEAVIDPLLCAIMPLAPTIFAALGSSVAADNLN